MKPVDDTIDDGATEKARAPIATNTGAKRKRVKKSRIPADDFKAIMQTNAHFYGAFSSLDMISMEGVWLKDNRCVCHFPGMKKLVSYNKIMNSWKHAVKEMDGATRRNWMEPVDIQVEFQTRDKAVVFCQELVYSISCSVVDGELRPESELIQKFSATNAFKRVDGKWYIWYHQASAMNGSGTGLKIQKEPPVAIGSRTGGGTCNKSEITSLTTNTYMYDETIPTIATTETHRQVEKGCGGLTAAMPLTRTCEVKYV